MNPGGDQRSESGRPGPQRRPLDRDRVQAIEGLALERLFRIGATIG
jgi:hypothetical protein